MGYTSNSQLAKSICAKLNWPFATQSIEVMQRNNKIYVRGAFLTPQRIKKLFKYCISNNWIYNMPFTGY